MISPRIALTLALLVVPAHAQRLTLEALALEPPLSRSQVEATLARQGYVMHTRGQRREEAGMIARMANRDAQHRFFRELPDHLHMKAHGREPGRLEEARSTAFREKARQVARTSSTRPSLPVPKAAGLGAALGLGTTAFTNPEALGEESFWRAMAGSLTGGAAGAALATAARGTPLWPVALVLPVVGGIAGGDLFAGRKVDWGRIAAHYGTGMLAALLLPASTSILTAAVVMMAVGWATDALYDADPTRNPAGAGKSLALLDVKSRS